MDKILKEKRKRFREQIYGNPNWITGRINRAEYFCRGCLLWIGFSVMMSVAVYAYLFALASKSVLGFVGCGAAALLALWILWRLLMTYVKRCHDLGWTGWMALPVIFSELFGRIFKSETLDNIFTVIVIILSLILLFKRGTKGMNKYGKDPLTKMEND